MGLVDCGSVAPHLWPRVLAVERLAEVKAQLARPKSPLYSTHVARVLPAEAVSLSLSQPLISEMAEALVSAHEL